MTIIKSATEAVENYLKAIYYLSAEAPDGVGANQQRIAQQVGVSNSGVSKMLRSMAKAELIEYLPYQPVKLTLHGEKIALEVIRHHRLLELYLMKHLGYGWDDVHNEADRLEHHISEEMEERIESLLGFPTEDPHGDPIPTRDGLMPPFSSITLASQSVGARVIVRRVVDEDAALLRYFSAQGVKPGAIFSVADQEPFGGSLVLVADDSTLSRITPQAAQRVYVEVLESNNSEQ